MSQRKLEFFTTVKNKLKGKKKEKLELVLGDLQNIPPLSHHNTIVLPEGKITHTHHHN